MYSFKYILSFFLFKDWVLETQLKIEFLTPNTGVWNQLYNTPELNKCLLLILYSKLGDFGPCCKEVITFFRSHVILQRWGLARPQVSLNLTGSFRDRIIQF